MDAEKEKRLVRTCFLVVTERDVRVPADAEDAFTFAKTISTEIVLAIRTLPHSTPANVQPEVVARYVMDRCSRFLAAPVRAAIIAEAIGAQVGGLAQSMFDGCLASLGLSEIPLQAPTTNDADKALKAKVEWTKAKAKAAKAKVEIVRATKAKVEIAANTVEPKT